MPLASIGRGNSAHDLLNVLAAARPGGLSALLALDSSAHGISSGTSTGRSTIPQGVLMSGARAERVRLAAACHRSVLPRVSRARSKSGGTAELHRPDTPMRASVSDAQCVVNPLVDRCDGQVADRAGLLPRWCRRPSGGSDRGSLRPHRSGRLVSARPVVLRGSSRTDQGILRTTRSGDRRPQKWGITLNAVYPSVSAASATPLCVMATGTGPGDVPVTRPVTASMAVTVESEAP